MTRTYPVPRSVGRVDGRVRVSESLLPVVAAGKYGQEAAAWADRILSRRPDPLTAAGYDPKDGCSYYAVTDWQEPDLLVAAVRVDPVGDAVSSLERWQDGAWASVPAHREPDESRLLPLSAALLSDLLDAGPGGLLLRPSTPKVRVRGLVPVCASAVVAAGANHDGVMVALFPSPALAKTLAVEGGEPPEDLHVTLAYLGDVDEVEATSEQVAEAVRGWASVLPPFEGTISGTGRFHLEGTEGDAVYASVDSPFLSAARVDLVQLLDAEGATVRKEHGFTPHLTLAYDKDGSRDDIDVPLSPIVFDHVTVAYGNERFEVPFGQEALTAGAPAPGTGGGMFAVVDELDTGSVLDLFRVDPGPKLTRFGAKGWEPDPSLLSALSSVDPPTVVVVPPEQLDAVTDQIAAFYVEHPDADKDEDDPETDAVLAAIDWAETKVVRDSGGRFGDKPDSMESDSEKGPQVQPGPGGPEEAPDPMEPHRSAQERREEQIRRQQATWDIATARRDETENRERDKFDELLSKGEVTEEAAQAEAKRRTGWARERTASVEAEKVRRLEIAEQERQRRDCIKAGNDPEQCADPKPLAAAGKPATSSMPGNLESYWARGKGAAKVRWGSSGDFDRCRRALAKYLKPGQIAGACANLHRKATGQWPGRGREH